jgi:hypothetical protein
MKPISLYKWECIKCIDNVYTWGRARGKSSKNWLSKHLVNHVIRQHIKLYHSGESIRVLMKNLKSNGEISEEIEEY